MKKSQVFIAAFALLLVVGVGGFIWYYQSNEVDYTSVRFIKQYQKSANNFADISGAINVSSADDIGYVIEGKMRLRIMYGDQTIKVTPKAFQDEAFLAELKGIGIEIQHRTNPETGNLQYRVTYWGTPVTQYTTIN